MIVAGIYPFNGGEIIEKKYPLLYREINEIIATIDANLCKTKKSKEKTMRGEKLYSPPKLNQVFKKEFLKRGWTNQKVKCEYPTNYYTEKHKDPIVTRGAFRDMDFLKDRLGVEVQFGKYAFMVYNVCAKMTIFKNLGYVDAGVEIVPIKNLAEDMSTGVSYFEQFVWDLQKRGISNIDIPVLIIGIDKDFN